MSTQHASTKTTHVRVGSAILITLLLTLTGCGSSKKTSLTTNGSTTTTTNKINSSDVLASMPMANKDGAARVDLLAVDKSAANTVTVRWRITNLSSKQMDLSGGVMQKPTQEFRPHSVADGVSLIDAIANKRYFPLYDQSGNCLCSKTENARPQPNASMDFYAVLPAPSSLQQIDFMVPLTPVFQAITVGSSPRPISSEEVDPAKSSLKNPDIVPLINTVEGTNETTDDSDADRSVRLSADVLFAINKSDLSPAAQAVLQQVAQQIDASSGTTVKVDGYTDSTGNDAINNPLSAARATSVEQQLQHLVTRQGINFQSAGHGSADPVADNGSEEGRQKNRRVTVTFARPTPPPAPASQTTSPAPTWNGGAFPTLAVATSNDAKLKDVKLELNSVHRDTNGLTNLIWTITNNSSNKFSITYSFIAPGQLGMYDGLSSSGIRLVDSAAKLQYNPLRDQNKGCLCANLNSGKNDLQPGESATWFNSYELPTDLKNVTVSIPGYNDVQNIEVK